MNKTLMTSITALLMVTTSVSAAEGPLAIWGGGAQGASVYTDVYVPHITKSLESVALSGYQWGGVSAGTLENAQRITETPTNLAVGQLDLLKSLNGTLMPNGKPYAFTILADDIGPECLYLVTKQPGYNTFGDFLGNSFQISVATGGPQSGSFGTFLNLAKTYPQMNEMLYENVGSAVDIVNAVAGGKTTHGFFVMRPDPQSATFKAIGEAGLTIVPVVDYGLEADYKFLDLKVSNGWLFAEGKTVTTACTSVALITGSQTSEAATALTPRDFQRLKVTIDRVGTISKDNLKPNISSWADMWDNLKVAAKDQLKITMDASKVALEEILSKQ